MDIPLTPDLTSTIIDRMGPITSATIIFRTQGPAHFSRFPGSAWRGAFGYSLKRLVCIMPRQPCETCSLREVCAFPQVFQPPGPRDALILARYQNAPCAFVLDPSETPTNGFYAPNETLSVTFRTFGRTTRFAPYVLRALLEAAAKGVGPDRVRLSPILLQSGLTSTPASPQVTFNFDAAAAALSPFRPVVPALPPEPITLRFTTPLRLRIRNDLVTPARFRPAHLLAAAVRRLSLLALCFGDDALRLDFLALLSTASHLEWTDHSFDWVETVRRSARQKTTMQMGGIVGRAVLDLGGTPQLWPFLWIGQWLHIGKSATMGFGRYRITTS